MNGIAKQQHTVPRFILANFSLNDKFYVYDKLLEKKYPINVMKACRENGFYDFEIVVEGLTVEGTIEHKLCEIEANASLVIEKILKNDSIDGLTIAEKESVIYLLASQMVRTCNHKYNYKMMENLFKERIKTIRPKIAANCELDKEIPDSTEGEMNFHFDVIIADSTEHLVPYFRELEWILAKTVESNPFMIGDTPVIVKNELYNDEESFYFSKYSIGYKGSCVYFPISSTRALWLMDEEVIKQYDELVKELLGLAMFALMTGNLPDELFSRLKNVVERRNSFNKSKTVVFSTDDVRQFNYYEITRAERRVFSKIDDFKQVEELIKQNCFYKHGARLKIY